MIEVENLTFSYQKQKQTLHGLNFSVADGEIFGFFRPEWFRKVYHTENFDGHSTRIWGKCPPFR